MTLFPARLDDYVVEDNPVRAVDVFVDSLDLDRLSTSASSHLTWAGRATIHG